MTVEASTALCFSATLGAFSYHTTVSRRVDTFAADIYDRRERSDEGEKQVYKSEFVGNYPVT